MSTEQETADTNQYADEDFIDSGVEAEAEDDQTDDQSEGDDTSDDDADAEGEGEDDGAEDDDEEVEHNGRKYRVPKAFAQERMLQADYTRKTTELAEQRRAFEQERAQAVANDEELREDFGRVHALKAQVKAFTEIDWNILNGQDPQEAQSLWMMYQQVQQSLKDAETSLTEKTNSRLQSQRETTAKAMQEAGKVLARDIKGWSPQLANNLAQFAIEKYGVSGQELAEAADPRIWKLLNDAYQGRQTQQRQKTQQRQETVQKVKPAPTVGKRPIPPTGLDDRLSTEEWTRRRDAQLRAKNARR